MVMNLINKFINDNDLKRKWIKIGCIWYVFISFLGFIKIRDIIFNLKLNILVHYSCFIISLTFIVIFIFECFRYCTSFDFYHKLSAKETILNYIRGIVAFYLGFGFIAFYYESIYRGSDINISKIIFLIVVTYIIIYLPCFIRLIAEIFNLLKKLIQMLSNNK